MVGGAVLNAAAFIGGDYLARALGGANTAAQKKKKVRHDKVLEVYQAAYAKCTRDRTKPFDWIETSAQIKEQAKQNFTDTDYTFILYNQAYTDKKKIIPPREPMFSHFYQPSNQQKNKLMFVPCSGLCRLPLPLDVSRHPYSDVMDAKLANIYYGPRGYG